MSYRVLFVCTGNICRSPIAARLLTTRLDGTTDIRVGSAGTRAMVGYAMDPVSGQVLRELGSDQDGHVGRQLTADLVRDADLVLTAGAEHRSAVLQLEPGAMRRTFTLLEFVRLGSDLADPDSADQDLRRRVGEVAARRGVVDPPVSPDADDIADPFGAPLAQVRACATRISEAVDELIQLIDPRSRRR